MTAQIIYATTGGNTAYFVEHLKIGLLKKFEKIELIRVEKATIESIGQFDLTIFVSPTYNVGNLPNSFLKFDELVHKSLLRFKSKQYLAISLGDSSRYDLFCGSGPMLEKIANHLGMKKIAKTINIDGETFGRADEFINLGEKITGDLKVEHSDLLIYRDLLKLFEPSSIAVIGVSEDSNKVGSRILKNIISGKFEGYVCGININSAHKQLYGVDLFKQISDVKVEIELVILSIPAKYALTELQNCIEKGISNFVIISSGFKEINTEEGDNNEEKLIEIINKNPHVNILGPNCLGFISSKNKLNASFANEIQELEYHKTGISFISQSGAICTSLLDNQSSTINRYNLMVSVGNKNSIDESDILNYIKDNCTTTSIGLYIEDIDIGDRFENALPIGLPIVGLFPGISKESSNAINSHTGAFIKNRDFLNLELNKENLIPTISLHEFENLLGFFSLSKDLTQSDFLVLTNAGGPAVVLTDLLVENSLELLKDKKLLTDLKKIVPEINGDNPVDMIGDANSERIKKILIQLEKTKKVLNIILYLTPQAVTDIDNITAILLDFIPKTHHNIFPIFMGESAFAESYKLFAQKSLVFFKSDEHLVSSLSSYFKWKNISTRLEHKAEFKVKNNSVIEYELGIKLLEKYNIFKPREVLVSRLSEVEKTFDLMKKNGVNRFVFKLDNSITNHKTEIGGVATNITSIYEIIEKYKSWQKKLNKQQLKCLLQEQLHFELEMFCGVKRNPSKPDEVMMIIGMGGIYSNIIEDITKFLLPVSQLQLIEKFETLKINQIINGARGKNTLPKNKIVDELLKYQKLIIENVDINEIDVNPLFITQTDVYSGDIKIYS